VPRYVVHELIRTEAKRGTHRRVEAAHRPLRRVRDQVVEPSLRAQGPVHEVGRERAVAVAEPRASQHRGHEHVRVGPVFDPHEGIERE
jgi:hypothetical protein